MSWENYDDYYEPSEFEQQVEEFKDSLRRSVKQETQELIEKLQKENEELRGIRDNWEEVKRGYEAKQRELQNKIYDCKQNAARMRLDQLFESCGMNVILYRPSSFSVYKHKCDKCDDNRYIHYKSPSGKIIKKNVNVQSLSLNINHHQNIYVNLELIDMVVIVKNIH